jgi:predicted nuclease of predicted toxin-antitoxin system
MSRVREPADEPSLPFQRNGLMARYLIDANLPRWFSLWSDSDYEFVHDLGPDWSDSKIWRHADAAGLTIITKDADFSDRVLLAASGPRVIHIRVGNLMIGDLHRYLSQIWPDVCRASGACRLVQVYRDRIESIE